MSQDHSSGSGVLEQDKGEGEMYLVIENRETIAAGQVGSSNYQVKPYCFNVNLKLKKKTPYVVVTNFFIKQRTS